MSFRRPSVILVAPLALLGGVYYVISVNSWQKAFVILAIANVVLLVGLWGLQEVVARQQEALKWYANHIHIDPHWRAEPMPKDLKALIEDKPDDRNDC
jgi:hypothetical protein